ncbi:MAG: M28 family metallopeptidase, partial [Planctomycetota bacterium]
VQSSPVFAANVIGFLEGSDPELEKEIVGIGSHLDHIGVTRGQINNGADDDGSGTTGVLSIAKAFSLNGKRPRRSLLFMCFCGEEKGLIGSRYYAEHPVFANERMVAELQMDMIGRNEERSARRNRPAERAEDNLNSLHLIGTRKLSEELHGICVEMNEKHAGFDFEYDEEDVFFRSDHVNFARQGIPIAFFFTGFHPQYHRPDDTIDRIDFPKLVRVVRLVYAIAFELADRDKRPKVDRSFEEATQRRGGRRRR